MTTILKTGLMGALLLAAACGSGSNSSNGGQIGTGSWLPLKVGYRWTYQVTDLDGSVSVKVQGVTAEQAVGGGGDSRATMAYKLVTGNKFNDPNGDVSYQGPVSSQIVRYRELSIDGSTGAIKKEEYYGAPWKLRVDLSSEHTTKGATWPESYLQVVVDYPKVSTLDGGATGGTGGGNDIDGGAGTGPDGGAGAITTMAQVTDVWSVVAVDEPITVANHNLKALVVRRIADSGNGSDKTFWFVRGLGKVKETGVGEQTEELIDFQLP